MISKILTLVALEGILSDRLNLVVGPLALQTLLAIEGVDEDQVDHVLALGAEYNTKFAIALEAEADAVRENARKIQHAVGEQAPDPEAQDRNTVTP